MKHVIRSLDNEPEPVGIVLKEQPPLVDENLTAVINYKINEFQTRQKSICEAQEFFGRKLRKLAATNVEFLMQRSEYARSTG